MPYNDLPEMIIATDGPATAEAEQLTAVAARHLIAPFCFDYRHSAFWTQLNITEQFSDGEQFPRHLLVGHLA